MRHIKTQNAHVSRAPLSQAVRSGDFVFTSGIVGGRLDGALADGPRDQMQRALENVAAVLDAAGSSFDRIVKVTLFLRDADDYAVVNEVYGEFFSAPYPARSTILASAPDPRVLVEVEVVAEVDSLSDDAGT